MATRGRCNAQRVSSKAWTTVSSVPRTVSSATGYGFISFTYGRFNLFPWTNVACVDHSQGGARDSQERYDEELPIRWTWCFYPPSARSLILLWVANISPPKPLPRYLTHSLHFRSQARSDQYIRSRRGVPSPSQSNTRTGQRRGSPSASCDLTGSNGTFWTNKARTLCERCAALPGRCSTSPLQP